MTARRVTAHNHAPLTPMTEARRQHLHGPLRRQPREVGERILELAAMCGCAAWALFVVTAFIVGLVYYRTAFADLTRGWLT